MNTPTRRLVPVEATEEMTQAAIDAKIFLNMTHAGWAQAYRAMLSASPNAGKVTEAEMEKAYEAAKMACAKCTQNFCGDCDCDGFTCKEGLRAALASIGLEVEGE